MSFQTSQCTILISVTQATQDVNKTVRVRRFLLVYNFHLRSKAEINKRSVIVYKFLIAL